MIIMALNITVISGPLTYLRTSHQKNKYMVLFIFIFSQSSPVTPGRQLIFIKMNENK